MVNSPIRSPSHCPTASCAEAGTGGGGGERGARTGGSTFTNPPGHKAWQLIDDAGCRGLMRGGAQVSEKHCNFLINTGSATAAEIEALGELVRRRVRDSSGIDLEWEIHRIGRPTRGLEAAA